MKIPVGFNSEAFIAQIRARVMETLIQALEILYMECKATVPIDTGELYKSIHIEGPEWLSFFWLKGRVAAGTPQAIFTEHGTRAHGPVFAKAMRFVTQDGTVVFTKWVRGVEAMHWMRNATDFSFPIISGLFSVLAAELKATIIVTKVTP